MAGLEAARGAQHRPPARTLRTRRVTCGAGVEPQARDDHEGVRGLRVDGDPGPGALLAPGEEAGRVERILDEAAAVQREGDGAGAVVAAGIEEAGAMAAAVLVGLPDDRVGGDDRVLDGRGSVDRRGGEAARGRWSRRCPARGPAVRGWRRRPGRAPEAWGRPAALRRGCRRWARRRRRRRSLPSPAPSRRWRTRRSPRARTPSSTGHEPSRPEHPLSSAYGVS